MQYGLLGQQVKTLNKIITAIIIILAVFIFASPLHAARVKDIANVGGVRDNQLMGYGLVIGLNGTGDKKGTEFTIRSVTSMLTKMGIAMDPSTVIVKNVAAVMVTAKLPPFVKKGSRIDVIVSSIGDSSSLQGGTLLFTPLKGANQMVYAVAQGPVSLGGYTGGGGGDSVQKNHSTVGRIADGAIIEKEVEMDLNNRKELTITLRNNDFSTAVRLADIVNNNLKQGIAHPQDARSVIISIPPEYENKAVELIAAVENLDVRVDAPARIILNERTRYCSYGRECAYINSGYFSRKSYYSGQDPVGSITAGHFQRGDCCCPAVRCICRRAGGRLMVLQAGVTVDEVVRALNSVGVTPRDR